MFRRSFPKLSFDCRALQIPGQTIYFTSRIASVRFKLIQSLVQFYDNFIQWKIFSWGAMMGSSTSLFDSSKSAYRLNAHASREASATALLLELPIDRNLE